MKFFKSTFFLSFFLILSPVITTSETQFTDLGSDMVSYITSLTVSDCSDLKTALQTLSALSRLNKEINKALKDPADIKKFNSTINKKITQLAQQDPGATASLIANTKILSANSPFKDIFEKSPQDPSVQKIIQHIQKGKKDSSTNFFYNFFNKEEANKQKALKNGDLEQLKISYNKLKPCNELLTQDFCLAITIGNSKIVKFFLEERNLIPTSATFATAIANQQISLLKLLLSHKQLKEMEFCNLCWYALFDSKNDEPKLAPSIEVISLLFANAHPTALKNLSNNNNWQNIITRLQSDKNQEMIDLLEKLTKN